MSFAPAKQEAKALASLAAEIRSEHEACERDAQSAVEHAIKAGELLIEAKSKVRHGEWLGWLEANFPAHYNTAGNYMRMAANSQRVVNSGTVREALAELAEPRAAEPDHRPAKRDPQPPSSNGSPRAPEGEEITPAEVLPPIGDQPAHYLPDVLEGKADDLRAQIVDWCSQGRRVDELLAEGRPLVARFDGDKEALLKGVEQIAETARKVVDLLR